MEFAIVFCKYSTLLIHLYFPQVPLAFQFLIWMNLTLLVKIYQAQMFFEIEIEKNEVLYTLF